MANFKNVWSVVSCVALLVIFFLAGCGGGTHPSPGAISTSILIVADKSSLAAGTATQLHAIDSSLLNSTTDVTDSVTWSSSDPTVATVSAIGVLTGVAPGTVTVAAKLGAAAGTMSATVTVATASSLSLTPQGSSLFTGGGQQFKATAKLTNGTTSDVTASTAWAVTPTSVATITANGLLTAVAPGGYTVTGNSGSLSATASGQVQPPVLLSIAVTPANTSLPSGASKQFAATGLYSNETTADLTRSVTWTSSNTLLLTINGTGLATVFAVDANTSVMVTATLGAVAGSDAVQLTTGKTLTSLQVKPTSSSIADGSAERHTAQAIYSDGSQADVTSSVQWSVVAGSSNARAATAQDAARSTPERSTQQSTSSDSSVVTVSQSGTDSGMSPGMATIAASLGSMSSQSVVIVTPAKIVALAISTTNNAFPQGSQQQMQLMGTFSDGSQQDLSIAADWTSSNPSIATVDSNGWITGVSPGRVVFNAGFDGLTATSSQIQVLPLNLISTEINVAYPGLPVGVSEQLSVVGTYADGSTQDLTTLTTWSASQPDIFAVDSNGLAYARSAGTGQITATVLGHTAVTNVAAIASALKSIQILPTKGKLALGTTLDFTALGTFDNGALINISAPALWTSENPETLTIDSTGRAKSGKVGVTRIRAAMLGMTAESSDVTVTNAAIRHINLTPATAQIAALTNQQFSASGFFTDGSFQDVTPDVSWSSSDSSIALVDGNGVAYGIKPGTVTISASLMGQSVGSLLTVTSAVLTSIDITPGNTELPVGVTRSFSLIGSFSDGTKQDLSSDAQWSAPTPSIVSVYLKGNVVGVSPGTGTISAERGFFSASTEVNVTNATLTSIALTPAATTIREGEQQQLTATGTFSDGFTQSLYLDAVFSAGNPSVALTSATGLISGVGVGSTQITASFRDKSAATTSFKVLSGTLSSIAISPASASVDSGSTTQLSAAGTYADGTTDDVSSQVNWTSSNTTLLTVDESGLATAGAGVTAATPIAVTASLGSVLKSVVVTIEPAGTVPAGPTLTSIDVTPTALRIAAGTTGQLAVIGTYSDGSTQDLSGLVSWSSAGTGVATVSGGLVRGIATGTTLISAHLGSLTSQSTVIVTPATLSSLAITPSGSSFAVGAAQQFRLIGTFSDDSVQDLTKDAVWSSASPSVLTVASSGAQIGLATGEGVGTAQITASVDGKSATTTVTITAATLVSLTISPATASFALGTKLQFHVSGNYSDGTVHGLTSSADFTSSDASEISVAAGGLATGTGIGTATISAAAGAKTAVSQAITVIAARLTSIAITPASASFAAGTTQQFSAIGSFTDGTTQDLSSLVVWSSTVPQTVTISAQGLARGNAVGVVSVSAKMGGIVATAVPVKVTAAEFIQLTLSPLTVQAAKGTKQQFKATGIYSDGTSQDLSSQVTWTSSNGAVASVDAVGLVTSTGVGPATITAAFKGKTASTASFVVSPATLVSIAFNPTSVKIAAGSAVDVEVVGTFSDGTTQDLTSSAIFESSNTSVATVSASGRVIGVAPGSSTITVAAAGMTSSFSVTVTNATLIAIAITPAMPAAVAKGRTEQFHASGSYSDGSIQDLTNTVTWISSNSALASIDASGLAHGLEMGTVRVSASYKGQSATSGVFAIDAAAVASVSVSPSSATVIVGATQQYAALATYSDGSTGDVSGSVSWSSSSPSVASVNGAGLATGVGLGTSSIVATYGSGPGEVSGSGAITVATTQLTLIAIAVTPTSSRLALGTSEQLTATGKYSDGTNRDLTGSAVWTSVVPSVSTVSSSGEAKGVAVGTASITATVGGLSGNATVLVSAATLASVAISPSGVSLAVGTSRQFTLTGSFTDGSTQDLTSAVGTVWASGDATKATVSSSGLATGVASGSVGISSSYGGKSATTTVNVTAAELVSIAITPSTASFAKGTTTQFHVEGTYSDGSVEDLTSSVTFSTSAASVVSIDASGVTAGHATGAGVGTAQISALVDGFTAQTGQITVTAATLVSIAITPSSPSFAAGTTQQFTAIGTFSDGSTQDLSSQVVWSSSNPQTLTISGTGLASAGDPGSGIVSASFGGVTVSTGTVDVTSAVLTGLTLSPLSAQVAEGTTQQFVAMGSFSDGSSQDLTTTVNWTSSNAQVASINAAGLAKSTGVGSATIMAATQGKSASTTSFTVTAATLVSIAFDPPSPSFAAGTSGQVSVIGTFSDGSTEDLTSSATFSSSNPASATVNSSGVVTGVAPGTSTITVQVDGMTSSFSVSVSNATLSSIAITPVAPASMAKGTTQQFTATGTYSDGTTQILTSTVNWTSSNGSLLTIGTNGLATAVAIGSVTVTATYQGKMATTPSFLVTAAAVASIAVTPLNASITTGATEQYAASATYTDSSTGDVSSSVTWSSSITSIASINGSGLASGVAAGSTTITAVFGSGSASPISGSTTLTVAAAAPELTGITVTPTSSHVASGTTQQFDASGQYSNAARAIQSGRFETTRIRAMGVYSDGSSLDLSNQVTWSSSNPQVASVTPTGLATGVSQGTANIEAQLDGITGQSTMVVTAATLVSVAISPSGSSFAAGATQQFTLTGTFSDGSTQDVTASATWSSLAPAVATVSSTGLATGVAAGTAQIAATYQGQSATTTIQITAATLLSVAISPTTVSFAKGTTQQFTATGTYSDGTTRNLTASATFSSSNAAVVTVGAAGLATGVGVGTAQMTVTVGGYTAMTQSVTVSQATLVAIVITPNTASFANGTTQQFTATGTFSDQSMQDLSSQVVWSSSNAQVLTIGTTGLATGGSVGIATISASLNGVGASTGRVQVTAATLANISISPTTAQIAKGTSQQFTATGLFTDGSTQNLSTTVTWITSNSAVASISASGLATGTGVGSAQLTAVYQTLTASTTSFIVTQATLVSIAFNPANPTVAAGSGAQVSVIGTFSDGSTQNLTSTAMFTSSNTAAVTVSSSGVVTGVAPGSSMVSVSVNGVTNSFNVTVSSATLSSIVITPSNPASIAKGTTEQFTATGMYTDGSTQNLSSTVTWTSANTTIATVDANGLATGTGVGTDQLTASYQGKSTNSANFQVTAAVVDSITVAPSTASIAVGGTQQFTAMATYTDNSTNDVSSMAAWTSNSNAVTTVNGNGLATGQSAGSATITATYSSHAGTATLTVSAPPAVTLNSIVITPSSASIAKGNTQQFQATGDYSDGSTQSLTALVAWQSSVPSIATINSSGLAASVAGGNTQIWASYEGVSAVVTLTVSPAVLVSIAVTPQTATLADGTSQQYKAVGTLTDGSTQDLTSSVNWSSTNTAVATISTSGSTTGLAVSHGTGTTTIGAQAGSTTATATLNVTAATVVSVQISPASVSLPAGGTQQLLATATFTDGSSQNVTSSVTYTSSNGSIASVNASGDVTGLSVGSASITATLGSISTSVMVTVSSAVLSSIAVTPANITLAAGVSQQLTATGTFTDGSTQNLTNSVAWTSSSSHTATVSNTGNLVAATAGSATITATSTSAGNSVNGTMAVTVTSAIITSITVSPGSLTLAAGQTQQYTAVATMSDQSQQTVTTSAAWSVTDPTRGTISNSMGSVGLLTTTAAGAFNVKATLDSISGSAPVTVTAAVLSSIAITPNPVSLPSGTTQPLTVTGHYSDGSTANVTNSATWTSSAASTATVNSTGVVSGNAVGSTTITAMVQGISATDAVTVTSPVLESITITPASVSLALGLQQQLTATGTYLGGATADITSQVQWSSTAPTVATVSNGGLITTLHTGSSYVAATLNSITAQIPLTVTAAALQSIAVTAATPSFGLGFSDQLTAIGTYSDSSTQVLTSSVIWSSLTPSVGVVTSAGLATGVSVGSFTARATYGGKTGSLAISVTSAVLQTILVTPANSVLVNVLGAQLQFSAIGHYSDGTSVDISTSVHWALSGVVVGSISQTGLYSAVGVGLGTITATSGTISGSTGLTVVSL